MSCPHLLISGSFNVFQEGWNGAGAYMFSGLYKSETFKLPIYIGSAENLQKRIEMGHIAPLNRNQHPHNPPLQCAWNKHGPGSFVVWCLEVCKRQETKMIEQIYLDFYRPFVDEFGGFNIAKDAISSSMGREVSEVTRAKISKANKGKKRSEEFRARMSKLNTGKRPSQETIEKRRKVCIGKKRSEEVRNKMRKPKSEEAKLKMQKAQKTRSFTIISIITGEIIQASNVNQFCKDHNLVQANFLGMLNGTRKSCGGWRLPETLEWGPIEKQTRYFTVISPQGEVISTNNLYKFCRDNNLNRGNFKKLLNGKRNHHKGWKLVKKN
jgi:group I intron endonuclease